MNTKVITISLLSLIGIGAFFYFKPKKSGQDKNSLTGGSLASNSESTLGTTTAPTTTSNTTTAPTSTLSVPPTQSSVTIGEVTLTTPVQVVETAIKISEAKNIASQIFNLRNQKIRYDNFNNINTTESLNDFAIESNNKFWLNNNRMLKLLLNGNLNKINDKIKELDKTLALLGYTEVNGSIQKI
jgi:hypothetical protein